MNKIKFAVIQFDISWENIEANLSKLTHLITNVDSDTDVVVLPEMFTTGFSMQTRLAESADGNTLKWMQNVSAQTNMAVCGSFMFKEGANKFYNRFFWVNPNGSVFFYNKKHLFSIGEEHHHYIPGQEKCIIQHKGFAIQLLVCYDLRFPVWIRRSNQMNYDAIVLVANWPERRAKHWQNLIQARAIENQCYVIACNRVGLDGNQVTHVGNSAIVSPLGDLSAATDNQEQILYGTIIKEEISKYRQEFPIGNDADGFTLL